MHETYLWPFANAVRAGTSSVMCSYHRINGINFPNPVPSCWGDNITISVKNGSLSEARVDDMVLRIMTPYFHLGQGSDFPPIDGYTPQLGCTAHQGIHTTSLLAPSLTLVDTSICS